jgi:hypothetical protein
MVVECGRGLPFCDPAHTKKQESSRQFALPDRVARAGDDEREQMPGMNHKALQALTKAWVTTLIVTVLLSAALVLAPVWNSAAYLSALPGALSPGQ